MDWNWIYKTEKDVLETKEKHGVPYLSFRPLEETGLVAQGFSTRMGGASKGKFATMNFSYSRGDRPEDVLENFTRMAQALQVERDRMVVSYQTHTVNVRLVTEEDAGKGVVRDRDYTDVDGLITNVPGPYACNLLCGLCSPIFVGSCEKGSGAQPFRMERYGKAYGSCNGQGHGGSLRKQGRGSDRLHWPQHLQGLF